MSMENLHATLVLDQFIKYRLTEALVEEQIRYLPVHGFCEVDPIPVNVLAWIITGGCAFGAA